MKRFVTIILLVSMVFSMANAEIIDFSIYSDDELLAIKDELFSVFAERKILKNVELLPGDYQVGRDIPSGKYLLKCSSDALFAALITVYNNEDDRRECKNGNAIGCYVGDKGIAFNASDGEIITVVSNPVIIESYSVTW